MRAYLHPALLALTLLALTMAGCSETPVMPKPEAAEESSPVLETIATGADISGANGIHFGPDGLLYITSVVGSDITILDTATGEVVRRLGVVDGVIGPDDVAFAPDGAYFWTSILTGEVAGFDAEGNRVVAARLPPGPNPITFSDDGRLFTAQCFLGSSVYELDPRGVEAARVIADDLGPGCGLNGMDWGPDDRLYGPRWFAGEVVSLDVETGERRLEAEGFATPAAVKFDSEGVLHVLDTAAGQIIRVENGAKTVAAVLEPGLDNFAFDASDTIFVSSFADGFIKRVNDDGTANTLLPGGIAHPGGVAVAGDVVWVADLHAIRGFDRATGEEVVTQRNIVGMGEMGGAMNLSLDGDNLILVSWFDGDARIWDPQARRRVAHFPDLVEPVAAVRYGGGVAISEHGKGSVTLYGGEEPIILAEGLPAPTGLLVDGDSLYVSDRDLGEIRRIATSGERMAQQEVVVSGLEAPEGFVIVAGDFVVVEAVAGRVVRIDQEGARGVLAAMRPGSPGAPGSTPSQIFNGIAVDRDGNLYVTGEVDRVLYRIGTTWH